MVDKKSRIDAIPGLVSFDKVNAKSQEQDSLLKELQDKVKEFIDSKLTGTSELSKATLNKEGRYVNDGWKESYRYIPEFVMPAGTVLTNLSGGEDIKIRPLRGDVYIKKLDTPPAGITYSKTDSDLPTSANLQDLVTGTNAIGAKPTVTLNVVDGEPEPSVIHGETIVAPE